MEDSSNSIQEIKGLIAKDQLREAIEKSFQLLEGSSFEKEIMLISANHIDIEKRAIKGIIQDSEYAFAKSKVRNSIIELLTIFETESKIKLKFRFLTPVRLLALITLGLGLIGCLSLGLNEILKLEDQEGVFMMAGMSLLFLGLLSFIGLLLALVVASAKNKF